MERLHTAAFEIRNVKRRRAVADGELAAKIINEGPLSLRRLGVNGIKWEVGVVASACYLSFPLIGCFFPAVGIVGDEQRRRNSIRDT
jgi:hypothetical protein